MLHSPYPYSHSPYSPLSPSLSLVSPYPSYPSSLNPVSSFLSSLQTARFHIAQNLVELHPHLSSLQIPHLHNATPLHIAATHGATDLMLTLLSFNPDPDPFNSANQTPLFLAAINNRPTSVRLLLQAGADPDLITNGYSVLNLAVEKGFKNVVAALLDGGATTFISSVAGEDPLHVAARVGDMEIARMLVEAGAEGNVRGAGGYTASEIAYEHGFVELAHFLGSPLTSPVAALIEAPMVPYRRRQYDPYTGELPVARHGGGYAGELTMGRYMGSGGGAYACELPMGRYTGYGGGYAGGPAAYGGYPVEMALGRYGGAYAGELGVARFGGYDHAAYPGDLSVGRYGGGIPYGDDLGYGAGRLDLMYGDGLGYRSHAYGLGYDHHMQGMGRMMRDRGAGIRMGRMGLNRRNSMMYMGGAYHDPHDRHNRFGRYASRHGFGGGGLYEGRRGRSGRMANRRYGDAEEIAEVVVDNVCRGLRMSSSEKRRIFKRVERNAGNARIEIRDIVDGTYGSETIAKILLTDSRGHVRSDSILHGTIDLVRAIRDSGLEYQ